MAALICITALGAAGAGEPSLIGEFKDWAAYGYTENQQQVCFAGSRPVKAGGDPRRRDAVWTLVTHDRGAGTRDVVSITPGYTFKPGSAVEVRIGRRRFFLFSKEDTAWATDEQTDVRLVAAMKRGRTMLVTGVSIAGEKTTDRFSLMGFTSAHAAITEACGL